MVRPCLSKRIPTPLLAVLALSSLLAVYPSLNSVAAANCTETSVPRLVPLNDLGPSTYAGFEGGLYSNGLNSMPAAHLKDGLARAQQITPRDKTGNLSSSGKIVLVTIGMSNTYIESNGLIQLAGLTSGLNPSLVIVNGAEGGVTAHDIVTNPSPYWNYVNMQLSNSNVTAQQVQAAWLKEADRNPSGDNITYARNLSSELVTILQMMLQRFPNLKLTYLSSRIYAGYASTSLNPEPYSYSSGFAVKWAIKAQIDGNSSLNYNPSLGPVMAPWIAWGPYMWANGLQLRTDGLNWVCSDFNSSDGTHPSIPQGQLKVGNLLLTFLTADPTATPWFLESRGGNLGGGGGTHLYMT